MSAREIADVCEKLIELSRLPECGTDMPALATRWVAKAAKMLREQDAAIAQARAEALEEAAKRWESALERPFAVLFLDGRNEHGTHVLPSFPTGLDHAALQWSLDNGTAELVMREAERLGFSSGEHVWTNWLLYLGETFDCSTLEFIEIDVELSRYVNGRNLQGGGDE